MMSVFSSCLGILLISVSVLAQIKSTNTESRPELVMQISHTAPLRSLAFSNDGQLVASISTRADSTIKLWEVETQRQLRTLVGHSGTVNAIAFSSDGRRLASSSDDDTIRIWAIQSGREEHKFYVPVQWPNSLIFSPDDRYLVSIAAGYGRGTEPGADLQRCLSEKNAPPFCKATEVAIWDVQTGKLVANLSQPSSTNSDISAWHVAFSTDGNILAFAKDGKPVRLWDLAGNRVLGSLPASVPPFVMAKNRIATTAREGGVVIWDLKTRKPELRVRERGTPVAFANRDSRLITSSGEIGKETIKFWDSKSGNELGKLTLDPIFDCANCSLHFSAGGRWLARGGFGAPRLAIWDLAAPERAPRLWSSLNSPIEFSPDGKWLAAITSNFFQPEIANNNIWLLDLHSGDERCVTSANRLLKSTAVAVSAEPARLATATVSGVELWDLTTGVLIKSFSGGAERITALAFSPDSRWLISGYSRSREAVTWGPRLVGEGQTPPVVANWKALQCPAVAAQAPTREEETNASGAVWNMATLQPYRNWPQMLAPIAISSDSKLVATAGDGSLIDLWNLSNKTVTELKLESVVQLFGVEQSLTNAIAFSPKHRWLAIAFESEPVKVLNVDTRKIIATLKPTTSGVKKATATNSESKEVSALAFDELSGTLAVASEDGTIRQWNIEDKIELSTFQTESLYPRRLAYSKDGKKLAITAGNKVLLWDTSPVSQRASLKDQPTAVNDLAFSNDGKLLFTAGDDGPTRIWDTESAELLATLISDRKTKDWLVVTPVGFFDGTAGAWRYILWRFDQNTFNYAPVESYFQDFFRPGLLQEILEGKRLKPPAGNELAKRDRRRPTVSITAEEQKPNQVSRTVTIQVHVVENTDPPFDKSMPIKSGAQDVRLFRNGSLVKFWKGDAFSNQNGCVLNPMLSGKSRTAVCTTAVPIVAGPNEFISSAFNHDNLKSDESKPLIVAGDQSLARKGVLYVLAIGINRYLTKELNLNFALADVDSISREFQTRQSELGNYARSEIITLADEKATKQNILGVLRGLGGTKPWPGMPELSELRQIQPEDALVIYFSGHGINKDNHFFLLPHDLREGDLETSSISDTELSEALERVDAGKIIMVIDACQSGQALGGLQEGRGPMNAKGLAQLAYDKGMYILTASQSYQAALEVSRTQSGKKIEHGLLTFSLLEALTRARSDSDGWISEREWMNYAVEQVPLLQIEEMKKRSLENRALPSQNQRGHELVFVANDKETDPEKRSIQRPRVFYRRELEARPLIVARIN